MYLSFNELTALPNLTCIQDTIHRLTTDGNAGIQDHSLAGDPGQLGLVNLELTSHPGDDILRLLQTAYINLRCHSTANFTFYNFNFLPDVMRVTQFNIRDCNIPVVPDFSIFPPGNDVTVVVLENCGIHTIPAHAFRTLTRLQRIYLHLNNLVTIDARLFATQVHSLTHIILHTNRELTIPKKDHVFGKLTSLKYLHLARTSFSMFPNLKQSCDTIEHVYLHELNTDISHFDYSQTFENCTNLKLIHFQNSLTEGQIVPDYSSIMAQGTARIYLRNSRVWCGCENAWIARVGRGEFGVDAQENLEYTSTITCFGPTHLQGRTLVDLSDEDMACPGKERLAFFPEEDDQIRTALACLVSLQMTMRRMRFPHHRSSSAHAPVCATRRTLAHSSSSMTRHAPAG